MSLPADRLLAGLQALELWPIPKKFHQSVTVPMCVAVDTPASPVRGCFACGIATQVDANVPTHPTIVDRLSLIHGDAIPLKVLLTIYRCARPYRRRKDEPTESYVRRAVTRLRLSDLTVEALGETAAAELLDPAKTARGPVDRLQKIGFIDVREDRGRGHLNFYIPHQIEPTLTVPAGLWSNAWIYSLSGAALLVLLQLFAHQQQSVPSGWELTRLPAALQPILRRGALLVDRDGLFEHEPDKTIRRGLRELTEHRLTVEIRAKSRTFIAIKDPDLPRPLHS